MKKILLRASMSPLLNYSPAEVVCMNLIGNNMGNMLFQSSVTRALLRKDMQIDTIHTKRNYTAEDIRKINETYECLVLPFANAFRRTFVDELNNTTCLVEKLKIPCIVAGVGAQAPLGREANWPALDEAVKKFMRAVLNKSAIVGVRGEFTAQYLESLGFRAEKDYTVIGCPSLYMYGEELPEMKVGELTPESAVSINSKISLPQKFHTFLWKSSQALPDHVYIPQVIEEIQRMFAGVPFPKTFWDKELPEHFPGDFLAPVYASGRGLAFANAPAWLRFLRKRDFTFGSRIHGNIASILAGTPCFVIVSDQRISELVEYHHIPNLPMQELKEDTDIFQLYEKADFAAIRRGHAERFAHYLDFWRANGIKTIFDRADPQKKAPYDVLIRERKFSPFVKAFSALTPERRLQRMEAVYRQEAKKNKFFREYYFKKNNSSAKDVLGYFRRKEDPEESVYPLIREYDAEAARLDRQRGSDGASEEP